MKINKYFNPQKTFVILINAVIFYYLVNWCQENIDIDIFYDFLIHIPLQTIFYIVMTNTLIILIMSYRFIALSSQSFFRSFLIVNLALGLNALLPARFGDVAKIYYGKKMFSISVSKHVAIGAIEKFFDVSILGCLAIYISMNEGAQYIESNFLKILIFFFIFSIYFFFNSHKIFSFLKNKVTYSLWTIKSLSQFTDYANNLPIKKIYAQTVLIWLVNLFLFYIAFRTLFPTINLKIVDIINLLLIASLAVSVPSTPSGFGIFEAGIMFYLNRVFNVPNESAFASAFAFHMMLVVPQILIAFSTLLIKK
jgi:uncharacterized protein (TIRG00374 family)